MFFLSSKTLQKKSKLFLHKVDSSLFLCQRALKSEEKTLCPQNLQNKDNDLESPTDDKLSQNNE